MAIANYFQAVQEIYIAYYQRPADPAGLLYWAGRVDAAGGDTTAIVNAFATSAEAASLYGDIAKDGVGKVIDKIYLALFGRNPDEAGKAFYEAAFEDGTVSAGNIAIAILNAAREKDVTAIENKVTVANTFTQLVAGRELTDPAFGTDKEFSFDYAGNDAAAAARQLLAKVTSDADTLLDEEAVRGELEGPKAGGGGGGAPSIKAFTVEEAIAANDAETLPKLYKLLDTLAHLSAENAASLVEKAYSYKLTDPAGSLGTLDSDEIALVKGAANHQLYTYGQSFTLTELIGTAGDDTIEAPAGSLQKYTLIDGGEGNDILKIDSTGNLTYFVPGPGSLEIRSIETIIFENKDWVGGDINASRFGTDTAIWQKDFDVDVLKLSSGQTAGFSNTDGDILVSYVDGAESASIAIENLASTTKNSFVISGKDLTTLSVSGSMEATDDAILRLHAETGTDHKAVVPRYVPTENIDTLHLALTTDTELKLTGKFTSLDTIDASASTGGIYFALPTDSDPSTKVAVGSGNDTVIVGSAQWGHTITTGEGKDKVVIEGSTQNPTLSNLQFSSPISADPDAELKALAITITDFDVRDDTLSFGPGTLVGLTNLGGGHSYVVSAASLIDALDTVAQPVGSGSDGAWMIFEYMGDTYIYQNNGAGELDTGDGLVVFENISASVLIENQSVFAEFLLG